MTDNEIIKALESVKENPTPFSLADKVMIASLDLINRLKAQNKEFDEKLVIQRGTIDWQTKEINRQKAEIERLKSYNKTCGEIIGEQEIELATAKAEAIKEFAEKVETDLDKRVSKNIRNRNPHWYIAKRIVRETAIEMTEVSGNGEV